tara:strand:+ start:1151 stop:3058 length:1908 start_codon:yes stop_codon:yes gene_type:complete
MLVEATSVKTVADRVFNLLKGYGFQIDTYNKAGEVVGDPADAIRFFVEDPNLLVTLNVPKEEIRLSISDNSDQTDTLRKQLDEIAKDYLMMLDFRVFGKTLKPSSEAINIQRDADMKEQNELRRLAGLEPINEERTVVGCNDDQSLYIFLNDEMVDLGKTEEAIATKLHELGDRIDFDDMYYSSSMDFASECGFPNDDAAKELMDKAIDTYSEIKFKKVRHTSDKGPGRDATSDDIAKINRGEEIDEAKFDSAEDCIRKTLEKEGGAAGLGALEDACKKAGFEDNVKELINKMKDVKEHEFGDYILEGKNCGCGQNPCKTYGTKKESVEETIVEASLGSMSGSIKTSNQPLGGTKIIVKHTKPVNEEVRGSRSRNIQKIFIEHNEERFLFPSRNLAGARAMARHLYNGGVMHDTIGESIVAMTKELKQLREFTNYVRKQGLINEENNDYVELAKQHINTIKETFKKLSGVKTYSKAVESIKDMNNIEVVNEVNLEDHFTETHFDDKVGNAHETLSRLVSRQSAFESMIMQTIESESFAGVKELISEEPLDFATPEAQLGHQVQQLSSTAKNPQLANFLGSIGNKLSQGGSMDQFEYRAVKASLLSAQRPEQAQMAEQFTEEEEYTKFIESFLIEE